MAERGKSFVPPDEQKRREYKLAKILPYLHDLPSDVVSVLLDHDLFEQDEFGNKITSMYKHNLEMGNVDREIQNMKVPSFGKNLL